MGVAGTGSVGLSPRERETLALMADGLTNEAIAMRLHVNEKTVESIVRSIFQKLDLQPDRTRNRRVAAVRLYLEELDPAAGALPVTTASFIGRTDQLDGLDELLTAHRFVTVVGEPGIGKTRLALEFAHRWSRRGGPVRFVGLCGVAERRVVDAVFEAFEIATPTSAAAWRRLRSDLHDKSCLVVLDNAEQVVDPVVDVVRRLMIVGGPAVVVTSRAALGCAGERLWRVPRLRVADGAQLLRDRFSSAGGELTDVAASNFESLDRYLDGLPLAIELFAARAANVSPPAEGWERALPGLLDDGAARRSGTLRTALETSYGALSIVDRTTFRSLSCFVGGFRVDGIDQFLANTDDNAAAWEAVERLTRCSLVTRDGGRHRLLEPIRQYAADLLVHAGESTDARRRFVRWAVHLTKDAAMGYFEDPRTWRPLLVAEADNIDSALRCSVDDGDITSALMMISNLWYFWLTQRPEPAWHRAREVLSGSNASVPQRVHAHATLAVGALAAIVDRDEALATLAEAERLLALCGDAAGHGVASMMLARITGAREPLDRLLEASQGGGSPRFRGNVHILRALLAQAAGADLRMCLADIDIAQELARSKQLEQLQIDVHMATAEIMIIGNVRDKAGVPWDQIRRELDSVDGAVRAQGDPGRIASMLRPSVMADICSGDTARARAHLLELLDLVVISDAWFGIAHAVTMSAIVLYFDGETDIARRLAVVGVPVLRKYSPATLDSFVRVIAPDLVLQTDPESDTAVEMAALLDSADEARRELLARGS